MTMPWFSLGAVALLAAVALTQFAAEPGRGATLALSAPSTHVERRGASDAPAPQAISLLSSPAPESRLLVIPVQGVQSSALTDTWGQARSEGRVHQGIDILAPQGTPVLAAADGRIMRFFDSARGGVTIYESDANNHFIYYYAHLIGRAPDLHEGDLVQQGQTIGFVGMTGNAPVPHLHFEIERQNDAHQWWRAEATNPYPYLLAGRAPT